MNSTFFKGTLFSTFLVVFSFHLFCSWSYCSEDYFESEAKSSSVSRRTVKEFQDTLMEAIDLVRSSWASSLDYAEFVNFLEGKANVWGGRVWNEREKIETWFPTERQYVPSSGKLSKHLKAKLSNEIADNISVGQMDFQASQSFISHIHDILQDAMDAPLTESFEKSRLLLSQAFNDLLKMRYGTQSQFKSTFLNTRKSLIQNFMRGNKDTVNSIYPLPHGLNNQTVSNDFAAQENFRSQYDDTLILLKLYPYVSAAYMSEEARHILNIDESLQNLFNKNDVSLIRDYWGGFDSVRWDIEPIGSRIKTLEIADEVERKKIDKQIEVRNKKYAVEHASTVLLRMSPDAVRRRLILSIGMTKRFLEHLLLTGNYEIQPEKFSLFGMYSKELYLAYLKAFKVSEDIPSGGGGDLLGTGVLESKKGETSLNSSSKAKLKAKAKAKAKAKKAQAKLKRAKEKSKAEALERLKAEGAGQNQPGLQSDPELEIKAGPKKPTTPFELFSSPVVAEEKSSTSSGQLPCEILGENQEEDEVANDKDENEMLLPAKEGVNEIGYDQKGVGRGERILSKPACKSLNLRVRKLNSLSRPNRKDLEDQAEAFSLAKSEMYQDTQVTEFIESLFLTQSKKKKFNIDKFWPTFEKIYSRIWIRFLNIDMKFDKYQGGSIRKIYNEKGQSAIIHEPHGREVGPQMLKRIKEIFVRFEWTPKDFGIE